MADRSLWPSAVFVFSALISFSACKMTADSASGNAGATDANPTNTPTSTPGAPAAAPLRRPGGLFRCSLLNVAPAVGAGVPTHPQGGAGVPHSGDTYASAVAAGVLKMPPVDSPPGPVVKRSTEVHRGGAPPLSALPELSDADKKYKQFDLTGGSRPQAVGLDPADAFVVATYNDVWSQALDQEEASGQPITSLEEFEQRAASMIEAVTTETLRRVDSNAAAQFAAPCGAPATGPTLAPPAAIAAAPGPAASTQQEDVDMAAPDVAQARAVAANNAEQLVQAMHPPDAIVQTIPPRSVPLSADAPASSAPAAPAPTSVAASQGGAAGGITACSADCFEAQRVAANKHYGLVAKLKQQLRDKKTEVKLLKGMMHSSSAAGGAGAAAPTALSSASSSAPSSESAAQQRIAELETQLQAAHHLVESVKQDWMLRAGFFPPGDPIAEAKKKKLKLNMLKDTSCTAVAIAKAQKAVRDKGAALAHEEDSLRLAAERAAIFRLEYEYAQMNLERKHKLAADATENDANNVDEQMRLLQEAEERKQRNAATKANTQRLRVDDAQLQQRLAVDQYEGVRAMFGTQANNLLMPSASSMPASPAGAGAGVAQPTPPSASSQQRNPYFEDEAEEASEDEPEQASETDSEDDADDKQLPD